VTIQGQRQYLWRTVDQDGDVIDILVQPRRDQRAVDRFFRKLLKGQGREPRRLVTDKLRTYEAARRTLMPSVVHDTERYANNRAEVSHEPIRQRERQMRGFKPLVKRNDSGRCTESFRIFSESDATCCGQLATGCCEAVPSLFGTRYRVPDESGGLPQTVPTHSNDSQVDSTSA
jgi:transposase-like protein